MSKTNEELKQERNTQEDKLKELTDENLNKVTGGARGINDPLIIIDGAPLGNLETLKPDGIESIDVLKDASSTAIYGSKGSN